MDDNVKIKTMKDDLAKIKSEPSKLSQQQEDKQQNITGKPATKLQNKTNIQTTSQPAPNKAITSKAFQPTAVKPSEHVDNKSKTTEISELKSLISRISKSISNDDSAKRQEEQNKSRMTKKESRITKTEAEIESKAEIETRDRDKGIEAKKTVDEITKYKKPSMTASDKKPVKEKTKKSFWESISEKLKTTSSQQKTYELNKYKSKPKNKDIKDTKENKIEEVSRSGILSSEKTEADSTKKENKEPYLDKNEYISPENRLIHGKQEYYSSIKKKIEPRKNKDEIKELESTVVDKKKTKVLSPKDEYKKLKRGIIEKYHIKLFSLPWKKIIAVSALIISSTGLIVYYLLSNITPPPPPPPPPIVAGAELEEFDSIQDKIEMTKEDVKKLNIIEIEANKKFSSNKNINILKLLITDQDNLLPLKEALQAINVINTETSANNLPENFLEKLTNDYNLFIFKTKQNRIRLGIAARSNDISYLQQIMEDWEEEKIESKKISVVFKPLFMNDRTKEIGKSFEQTEYKGITIRYLHLPNQDTALNYFTYNDILVVATSKDNVFQIADLLVE
jgi:hypothetical protein